MSKVLKLDPFISQPIWGGVKLAKLKNIKGKSDIGETWEVSTHKNGSAKINGIDLSNFCSLTYLTKFIDTADNLSIQVHPGDDYAEQNENDSGKMESWLILDAQEGAGIYLGFKKGITKKEFFTALENKLDITRFLNFKKVKRGDFFVIPEGTIHAIGAGITLCEVQQSSGVTYRVWDWNRTGKDGSPRELHIDKARDVLNFSEEFNQKLYDLEKSNVFTSSPMVKLISHKDFKVELINFASLKKTSLNLNAKDSLTLFSGSINGDITLNSYESAIVMETGEFEFTAQENTSLIIVSE